MDQNIVVNQEVWNPKITEPEEEEELSIVDCLKEYCLPDNPINSILIDGKALFFN